MCRTSHILMFSFYLLSTFQVSLCSVNRVDSRQTATINTLRRQLKAEQLTSKKLAAQIVQMDKKHKKEIQRTFARAGNAIHQMHQFGLLIDDSLVDVFPARKACGFEKARIKRARSRAIAVDLTDHLSRLGLAVFELINFKKFMHPELLALLTPEQRKRHAAQAEHAPTPTPPTYTRTLSTDHIDISLPLEAELSKTFCETALAIKQILCTHKLRDEDCAETFPPAVQKAYRVLTNWRPKLLRRAYTSPVIITPLSPVVEEEKEKLTREHRFALH